MRAILVVGPLGTCLLAPLTTLKTGDIQPVEFFLGFWMLLVVVWIAINDWSFFARPELMRLSRHYAIFFLLTLAISLFALRLEFYPPPVAAGHLFKARGILSIARLAQFGLAASAMIVLANLTSRDPRLIRFLAAAYMWVGVTNATYAIASWLALYLAHIDLLGAYVTESGRLVDQLPRARAFFNEGGPYGVYAVSVILVTLFRRSALHDIKRGTMGAVLLLVGSSLALSASKAGIICSISLWLWQSLHKFRVRQIAAAVAVAAAILTTPLVQGVENYWYAYQVLEYAAAQDPHDYNLVVGRVAGMYIMPRMVADHPISGVGFGNYPLIRNSPQYLQMLPDEDVWDIPGLGLIEFTAELGIPMFLYLLWIVWTPVRIGRRLGVPGIALVLGGFQLFAELLGAQITFFYPWLATSLAMGFMLEVGRSGNAVAPRGSGRTRALLAGENG